MNEETKAPEIKQPVVPIKPAAKTATKQPELTKAPALSEDEAIEIRKEIQKAAAQPALQPAHQAISPLAAFIALVEKAPKEHLPTMLVKLANKCISEKVFATGKELADAIVGASKVK